MVMQSDAVEFGRHVASEFARKNVPFMSAALAYYAFISLAPMLLLLFVLFTTVGVDLDAQLVRSAIGRLPDPIAAIVTDSLSGGADGTGASIVGMLVLGWGTVKLFLGLDTAFSQIYGTVETGTILGQVRDGAVVFAALAAALVAMLGSSVVLSGMAGGIPYSGWVTPLILLSGLVVAFYPIYYVFPDADLDAVDALPGVVVAAVGWGTLQGLFQFYLSVAQPGTGYFFSGVIVVVTYLYFSALVLLLGAVINAALDRPSTGGPERVGQSADSLTTERRTSLERSELSTYLTDLRTDLFEDRDAERSESVGARPRPTGDIELVEQSRTDGETNEWLVRLRWEFSDDELVASMASRTGSTDGDEATERPATSDATGD